MSSMHVIIKTSSCCSELKTLQLYPLEVSHTIKSALRICEPDKNKFIAQRELSSGDECHISKAMFYLFNLSLKQWYSESRFMKLHKISLISYSFTFFNHLHLKLTTYLRGFPVISKSRCKQWRTMIDFHMYMTNIANKNQCRVS